MAYELGIIGAGNMAEAIVRGVIRAGLFPPGDLIAADVSPQRREFFSQGLAVRATDDSAQVARDARRVLLSVKPQQMAEVLSVLGPAMRPDALVISIAAGISTGYIERHLGPGRAWRVVRAMPNTPMLVGEGIAALAPGRHATTKDLTDARRLFESAGSVVEVTEDKLDAVTALSGSGPAYVFYLVEHMIRAGVELGLTPQQARQLAMRTALGASKMLVTTPDSPEELRRKVTSPGGTTQAAITHMEKSGVGPAVVDAIKAADKRSRELGL
jgi:pyrroline-5-carboxylate reductase